MKSVFCTASKQGTEANGRDALSDWPCALKNSFHIFHLPRPCPAEMALKMDAQQFSYIKPGLSHAFNYPGSSSGIFALDKLHLLRIMPSCYSQLEFPVVSGRHTITKYRSLVHMSSYIGTFFMWNQAQKYLRKCCTCLRRLAASQRPLSKGGKTVMANDVTSDVLQHDIYLVTKDMLALKLISNR
jgi:hypothetical protein